MGTAELAVVACCDSPKGVGNGEFGRRVELADGKFTAEVWARRGGELVPYLDPFSPDGPTVDVDLPLFQYSPDGRGGRNGAMTAKLRATVIYP